MAGRIVVAGVTRAGACMASQVAAALPAAEAYVPARWMDEAPGAYALDGEVGAALPRLFRDPSVGGLVVVLAVGATVRLLAPWLRGKSVDPAVVALDDSGRFAVALLSGHRGGANRLAQQVAQAVGACPVVTTASDGAGLLAVDLLGAEDGWKIEASEEALRHAAAAAVNGERVGVYQDAGSREWLASASTALMVIENLADAESMGLAALLLVSDHALTPPAEVPWCVTYRPPTLVAGVGCSRGASMQDMRSTVELALAEGGLAAGSLALLATIDRRLDEPGVVGCAANWQVPLRGYSAEQLAAVGSVPNPSVVVQQAVGTPGVCEPAALLASGATEILVPKVKSARATAAIARIAGA